MIISNAHLNTKQVEYVWCEICRHNFFIAWCKTRVNDRIDYLLVVEYTTMFFTYRTAFHSTKDFGWST